MYQLNLSPIKISFVIGRGKPLGRILITQDAAGWHNISWSQGIQGDKKKGGREMGDAFQYVAALAFI